MNSNNYHIADDLLVKYMLGEATEEETRLVEAWIYQDAANKKQYEDFRGIWEKTKALAAVSDVDEDDAWQRFKSKIEKPNEKAVVRKMQPTGWFRIAALFIVVMGAGYFGYKLFSEKPVENVVVASKQVVITDTLPDGSVVTLNKNSSVNYPSKFKGDTRTIALQGEAFFNVTPNKEKPFIIHVNDVTIRVVGTSFNVSSINGVTEVIVETGIVQVTRNNNTVELKPKEKTVVKQADSLLTTQKEEEQLHQYYRTREFVCDGTPLWKLVDILNKAYDTLIVIENPKLRSYPLNTTFNNESLVRILEIIQLSFPDITINKKQDRIVLQ